MRQHETHETWTDPQDYDNVNIVYDPGNLFEKSYSFLRFHK